MLNNQLCRALLLLVSLLTPCPSATGGDNRSVNMQSNSPPTNTPSIPTAEAKTPPPATRNAVRVARWSKDPESDSLLALLYGTLAIVNNCLVVKHKDLSATVVVFPYGKGVWNDAKRTFTYEGKVIRIGEPIVVGGGYLQNLEQLKKYGKYDVPDCGINRFFQTF